MLPERAVEDRRRVDIRDTELAQISQYGVRVGEAELRRELEPIGCPREFSRQ
jgi:hypothetical protein